LTLPTVSNYTIHDATDGTNNGKQEGERPHWFPFFPLWEALLISRLLHGENIKTL
jgi:hypothetical protein